MPEDEYKVRGAIKIVPGMKNVSKSGLLNWDTSKHKPTTPVKPAAYQVTLNGREGNTSSPTAPALSYQLDVAQAGTPSYNKRNLNDNPAYNWSEIRRAHHGTSAPFGVDSPSQGGKNSEGGSSLASYAAANNVGGRAHINHNSNNANAGSPQVKSLSDTLKAKKSEPRSLASLMAEQQQR